MNSLWVLVALLPIVVNGRVSLASRNDKLDQGIALEDLKQILELNDLTEKIKESGDYSQIPIQSYRDVTEDDVSFYVYNNQDTEPKLVLLNEADDIASLSAFNISLKTVVVIHGWHNEYNSTFNEDVGEAYLDVADVNIISVDWDNLASEIYVSAQGAVPYVGEFVGQFIGNISVSYNYSLDNFFLVGHSLGAHVCGFAGKQTNGAIHSITGLDPAGPLYFQELPNARLNEGDAQYVQAIHTCGSLLGVHFDVGKADYWPNGGLIQPGCGADVTGSCSHSRSYLYFVESLYTDAFISKECGSYIFYTTGLCKTHDPTIMGGAFPNVSVTGQYYLKTNSSSPYALGDTGL